MAAAAVLSQLVNEAVKVIGEQTLGLVSSGGFGPEVSYALRAVTLPGAPAVLTGLSALPAAVLNRLLAAAPAAISGTDAREMAEVVSGLRGKKQRTAFIRTARCVIDWRGQAVSAQRHSHLLSGVPLFMAWGSEDTTIPPHHHRSFAARVSGAVTLEVAGAGHYPHETHSAELVTAMRQFLRSTHPFEYSEANWVARLTPTHASAASAGLPETA